MAAVPDSGPHAYDDGNRTFAFAVVASLLVHAVALIAMPGLFDHSRTKGFATPPIFARLVQPPPPPVAEPAIQRTVEPALKPKAQEIPDAPRRAPPVRSLPASPVAPPLVSPLPAPPMAALAPAPRGEEPPAAPAVIGTPSARLEPAPQAPATAPAAEAADALTLGQYRIAIITAAKRYKKYPRLALDNNWEGQAEIRMVIDADGNIGSIRIKTRSGFEVLDQQALEMIRKAKPLAPIPAALRGRGFTVDVPVVFSLKEETG